MRLGRTSESSPSRWAGNELTFLDERSAVQAAAKRPLSENQTDCAWAADRRGNGRLHAQAGGLPGAGWNGLQPLVEKVLAEQPELKE